MPWDLFEGIEFATGLLSMFAAYCCLHVKKQREDAFEEAYKMMRLSACCFLAAIVTFCIDKPYMALPGLFHG
jgi:branched-subunit amino acid ABC-type transport system permease component